MSPDFNPIKNLWQEFRIRISCQSPKDVQELECVTIEEWKKIKKNTCSNLIKKFRKRLQHYLEFFSFFYTV